MMNLEEWRNLTIKRLQDRNISEERRSELKKMLHGFSYGASARTLRRNLLLNKKQKPIDSSDPSK